MNEPTALSYRSLVGDFTNDRAVWESAASGGDMSDRRDGAAYVMSPELLLAVNVALATGRPLLLRGEPGCGKSSFAAYVARNLGWRYYEHVVTSATAAEDLLWRFDAVRRLADAQIQQIVVDATYVEPGALWWVLDPVSAARRGASGMEIPPAREPFAELNAHRMDGHAVLLIDELDKADPDLPNGLLVPLGSRTFTVAETGFVVDGREHLGVEEIAGRVLVVITTNEERQLPPALLRRCVVHTIATPQKSTLTRIAALQLLGPDAEPDANDAALFEAVAERLIEVRKKLAGSERLPSTAEYLDAVRACRELEIRPADDDSAWALIEKATLTKPGPQDEHDASG